MMSLEQRIALIGASGVGKSCFIAALRWLGSSQHETRFTNIGADGDTDKALKFMEGNLRDKKVPESTEYGKNLEFQEQFTDCKGRERRFSIKTRDFRGGEIRDMGRDSRTFHVWQQSDYLLVFLDAKDIQEKKDTKDIDDVFDQLSKLDDRSQKKLAVLLTKSDSIGENVAYDSPECAMDFFKQHRLPLVKTIGKLGFKEWKCFFIASLGVEPKQTSKDGLKYLPVEPTPQGYEALFDWLAQEEAARQRIEDAKQTITGFFEFCRKNRSGVAVAIVAFLMVGVCWIVVYHRHEAALQTWQSSQATMEEKAAATWNMREEDARRNIDEALENYENELSCMKDIEEVRRKMDEGRRLLHMSALSEEEKQRLAQIEEEKKKEISDASLSEINESIKVGNTNVAKDLIEKRLRDEMIQPEIKDQIRKVSFSIKQGEKVNQKKVIASIAVGDFNDTENLKVKMSAIAEFFGKYADREDSYDASSATKAIADMGQLLGKKEFHITEIKGGTLKKQRTTYVLLASKEWTKKEIRDEKDEHLHTAEKKSETVAKNGIDNGDCVWDANSIKKSSIAWSPGDKMKVEWVRVAFMRGTVIASYEISGGWTTLLEMIERHYLDKGKGYEDGYFKDNAPWVEISCDEFPDPAASLERIKRFIIPGTYWSEEN